MIEGKQMILSVTLNTSIDKLYMLDSMLPYTVMRVKEVRNTAGGKGMNVARVAAQLGEKVIAMGFVGGHNGTYFESLITEDQIRKAFTHVAAETRSCINCWDLSCNRSTEYLEPGAAVTGAEIDRFFTDFQRELKGADAVTISGSMPKGVPVDCYSRLIRLCREAGIPSFLDASGETLRQTAAAGPFFVKPNAEELGQLLGYAPEGMDGITHCAVQLKQGGIDIVVVSLGAQGALMACGAGVFWGKPPQITPKNTVGCGDSMVAAFAVATVRGLRAPQQLRLAVAVSAANALYPGTGGYDEAQLDRIMPEVAIQQIQ
jgi:tagatose 6-phosphate kinase